MSLPFLKLGRTEGSTTNFRALHPWEITSSPWVVFARLLVFSTALTLMIAQSRYLYQSELAGNARWVLLGALAAASLARPNWPFLHRSLDKRDWPCLAFLILAGASTLYSQAPRLTAERTLSLVLFYGAIWWTVSYLAEAIGSEALVNILLLAATLIFAAGPLFIFFQEPSLAPGTDISSEFIVGRYRGIFDNPNAVGLLGVVFFPLAGARWAKKRSISNSLLLVVIAVSMAASGSRNGLLAASLSLSYMTIRRRAWVGAFLLLILSTTIYLILPDLLNWAALRTTPGMGHLLPNNTYASGGGRFEAWNTALPLIRKRLALGYGFGTEDLIFRGIRFRVHSGAYIHNSYLGAAYQLGITGAALLFLPLFGLVGARLFVKGKPSLHVASLEAVVVAGLAAAMFESWVYSVGNAFAFPFWVVVLLLIRSKPGRTSEIATL